MATATLKKKESLIKIKDIEVGDVFSEISHYTYVGPDATRGHVFNQIESGDTVYLAENYVLDLLSTADQWNKEVKVGKEDKLWTAKQIADAIKSRELPADHKVNVGDVRLKGIRTLFEGIYNSEVFAVSFKRQDTKKTVKELEVELAAQKIAAVAIIEKAKASKKSVAAAAAEAIAYVQKNPISDMTPGTSRELYGYKIQFTSRDGRYDCIDMHLPAPGNVRPVNINTLEWLVYKGIKYVVE